MKKTMKTVLLAGRGCKPRPADVNWIYKDSLEFGEDFQEDFKSLRFNFAWNDKTALPDSFFIWMPKEIVGGDIFFADFFEDGFVMAVIDCTGHGVPGAFMTMLAYSALRRIVRDEGCHDPAQILKKLNFIVKTMIHQNSERVSDDGMDAAICFVSGQWSVDNGPLSAVHDNEQRTADNERQITFASAKMPLIYVHNGQGEVIKGDRQSIGYQTADLDFDFTNHVVKLERGMSFYMFSDGFEDQLGGENGRRLGMRRFKNLLKKNAELPFEKQQELLLQALKAYRGEYERQDDVTVIGFGF
ncbi:MAG: hypothetical protein DRI57_25660 [Deltaproteobacteria bacterium]|nr:MAG: hypothetical protein DRI57_25660 [Deltaproteobacteria bacterium]